MQGHSFAIWTFVSQLLNSVLVLLLVNARQYPEVNTDTVQSSSDSWITNILLSGPYSDFTPIWYEDVGFTMMVSAQPLPYTPS